MTRHCLADASSPKTGRSQRKDNAGLHSMGAIWLSRKAKCGLHQSHHVKVMSRLTRFERLNKWSRLAYRKTPRAHFKFTHRNFSCRLRILVAQRDLRSKTVYEGLHSVRTSSRTTSHSIVV